MNKFLPQLLTRIPALFLSKASERSKPILFRGDDQAQEAKEVKILKAKEIMKFLKLNNAGKITTKDEL